MPDDPPMIDEPLPFVATNTWSTKPAKSDHLARTALAPISRNGYTTPAYMDTPSAAKTPYPMNRHAEVCSINCRSHMKNETSPITRPRTTASPQKESPKGQKYLDQIIKRERKKLESEKPLTEWPDNEHYGVEYHESAPRNPRSSDRQPRDLPNPAYDDFELFLQNSNHNSAAVTPGQFDSFSNRKPTAARDPIAEALRESAELSSQLEEGRNKRPMRPPLTGVNIFHG